ncbi:uncharacterized protein LOC141498369 [Macrotis lagotis]|uniref:uncharacterized protein LOC141498369 n=1 Tax=Macrotis lagotis TaxID=92651 RepID=UPI003D684DAB
MSGRREMDSDYSDSEEKCPQWESDDSDHSSIALTFSPSTPEEEKTFPPGCPAASSGEPSAKRTCYSLPDEDCMEDNDFLSLTFPRKLWKLVESSQFRSIHWNENGNYVVIHDTLFREEVLGKRGSCRIFETDSIKSFIRQLNLYGFVKLHKDLANWDCHDFSEEERDSPQTTKVYCNPNFRRGNPHLLLKVKRRVGVKNACRRPNKRKASAQGNDHTPPSRPATRGKKHPAPATAFTSFSDATPSTSSSSRFGSKPDTCPASSSYFSPSHESSSCSVSGLHSPPPLASLSVSPPLVYMSPASSSPSLPSPPPAYTSPPISISDSIISPSNSPIYGSDSPSTSPSPPECECHSDPRETRSDDVEGQAAGEKESPSRPVNAGGSSAPPGSPGEAPPGNGHPSHQTEIAPMYLANTCGYVAALSLHLVTRCNAYRPQRHAVIYSHLRELEAHLTSLLSSCAPNLIPALSVISALATSMSLEMQRASELPHCYTCRCQPRPPAQEEPKEK